MHEAIHRIGDRFVGHLRCIGHSRFVDHVSGSVPLTALALSVFTLFWNFPSYDVSFVLGEQGINWPPFFEQVGEPFVDHSLKYSEGHHARTIGFRFVPAVIFGSVGIHTVTGAVIFQLVTLLVFNGILFSLLSELVASRSRALFLACAFGLVASGHAFAGDLWGFFDMLALCFLLASIPLRDHWSVVVVLLLAYFTDERALIASPALVLINAQLARGQVLPADRTDKWSYPVYVNLLVSWTLYALIRTILSAQLGLRTGIPGPEFLIDQIWLAPWALYHGCEAFIVPIVMAMIMLREQGRQRMMYAYMASLVAVWIVALSVIDIERSMVYVVLHLILALMILLDGMPNKQFLRVMAIVLVVNLLYSDVYPLPAQLYRMVHITGTL